ncbi:FxsA family protein [Nocardioidaceae bacterium]|nr:FxsA family protein [Nocardioidaceae bacterium]
MSAPGSRRRSAPWGLLLAAFIVVPLIEIYLLVQVGQVIGAGWTILLLVFDSVVGVALVRREGTRAWRDLQATLQAGRAPTTGLADAALLLIGATLLVTPGFLTDAMGLLLVLPVTRPLLRGALARRLSARVQTMGGPAGRFGGVTFGPTAEPGAYGRPGPGRGRTPRDGVVEGVVVESHEDGQDPPEAERPPDATAPRR